MRSLLTILVAVLVTSSPTAFADTYGPQSGVWPGPDTVQITGEVWVPTDSTLVIEPGVVVLFEGYHKFWVDTSAILIAVGTEADSIVFTPADTGTGWHGIRFYSAHPACSLSYCRIEYGKAIGDSLDGCGGAILCYESSITMGHNLIAMNFAGHRGGGIYCYGFLAGTETPCTIEDNVFYRDSTTLADGDYGGGIYCAYCSNLFIVNNTFDSNSAYRGGAIHCARSENITVRGNTVSHNRSVESGAGIRFQRASGLISENLVYENWNTHGGGGNGAGIYCRNCDSTTVVERNIVWGNHAARFGGGIYCRDATPLIINNTIALNDAGSSGGGICCRENGNPKLVNNVLWNDSLLTESTRCFSEMSLVLFCDDTSCYPCTLTVSYSDVEGGQASVRVDSLCVLNWEEGNLDSLPLFVGPEPRWHDFHLRWHSPCIDAGDTSLIDPDSTRSDIGRFYFNQAVPGIIELYPYDTPIFVPSGGDTIYYDRWAYDFSDDTLTVDIWSYLYFSGTGVYDTLYEAYNVAIPPHDSVGQDSVSAVISDSSPSGTYTVVAYIGECETVPHIVIDSTYFYLYKEE
jgi:hypothetical protein